MIAVRRGFTLIEMAAVTALLMALLMVTVGLVSATAAQRQASLRRQTALREAANAMELLAARDAKDLTASAAGMRLSPEGQHVLPGGTLTVEIGNSAQAPAMKRITVSVQWQDPAGNRLPPLRLVAWRR